MKEYKERVLKEFEAVLPLIVEDYNNFIAEAGEIGECDIEDIWAERVKPLISQALDGQVEEERQWLENALDDGRPLGDLIKERLALIPSPSKE